MASSLGASDRPDDLLGDAGHVRPALDEIGHVEEAELGHHAREDGRGLRDVLRAELELLQHLLVAAELARVVERHLAVVAELGVDPLHILLGGDVLQAARRVGRAELQLGGPGPPRAQQRGTTRERPGQRPGQRQSLSPRCHCLHSLIDAWAELIGASWHATLPDVNGAPLLWRRDLVCQQWAQGRLRPGSRAGAGASCLAPTARLARPRWPGPPPGRVQPVAAEAGAG